MTDFNQQRQQILARIAQACQSIGRDTNSVSLLAVSKTHSASSIRELYHTGQREFAENYLQEASAKQAELMDLAIEWHFIGPVQRNKTRDLAAHFAWVHGVDRLVIAERLSAQRPLGLPALNLCIQVNIDDQASKSGCHPDQLPELVQHISGLPNVRLRGLMVIPAPHHHAAFEQTRQHFEMLRGQHQHPADWDTLSMG
ncbi:MAG: YggS family pyridoxal phosphate-dependent enzyme, partial [Pseudomonadota bacterium]|nr:YggS family pyridoxal phosphate-dependent enzyme [Pseudomonadota bacterium]